MAQCLDLKFSNRSRKFKMVNGRICYLDDESSHKEEEDEVKALRGMLFCTDCPTVFLTEEAYEDHLCQRVAKVLEAKLGRENIFIGDEVELKEDNVVQFEEMNLSDRDNVVQMEENNQPDIDDRMQMEENILDVDDVAQGVENNQPDIIDDRMQVEEVVVDWLPILDYYGPPQNIYGGYREELNNSDSGIGESLIDDVDNDSDTCLVCDEEESECSEENPTGNDHQSKVATVLEIAKKRRFVGLDELVKNLGINHGWLWCKLCDSFYMDLPCLKVHTKLKHPRAEYWKITKHNLATYDLEAFRSINRASTCECCNSSKKT